MKHTPVMVREVLDVLVTPSTRTVVDATVGAGGHAQAVLDLRDDIQLIGLDRDPTALSIARRTLDAHSGRVQLIQAEFADIKTAVAAHGLVDGVLLDLGVSSMQIDDPQRGFSYNADAPLDMRMSDSGETAREMLARIDVGELTDMLKRYADIRPGGRARRIARKIASAAAGSRMNTTAQLKSAVREAVGDANPSLLSRVFQSVRIAINGELDQLRRFLDTVLDVVSPGGRLVWLSYHSLEDRMVKTFLREQSRGCTCPPEILICVCGASPRIRVLTRRVIKPSSEEIAANARARSARLRAAEVIGGAA